MNCYSYEDLKLGDKESFLVQITERMMELFREMTGDTNPLHTNQDFAISHHCQGRVVYGMLTASMLSTLVGCYLPGEYCLIQSVEVKFSCSVYIGDILLVEGVITGLNDTVHQIEIKVEIFNQSKEKVLRGKVKVGMLQ